MASQIKNPKMIRIKLPKQRLMSLNACNSLQPLVKPKLTIPVQKTAIIQSNIVKQRATIVRREDTDNNVCYFEVFDHSIGKENSDTDSPSERVYVTPQIPIKKDGSAQPNKSPVVQNVRVYTDSHKTGLNSATRDMMKNPIDKHEMMIQKTYKEIMDKKEAKEELLLKKRYQTRKEIKREVYTNVEHLISNEPELSEEDLQNDFGAMEYQEHDVNETQYKLKIEPKVEGDDETQCEYATQTECTLEYEDSEVQEETVTTLEPEQVAQVASSNQDFEETMDTFFISNNIPDKVAIVRNDEKTYTNKVTEDVIIDTQNEIECETPDDTQESIHISDQNLFQIVTENGTLLLHNNGVVQELIKKGQLIINNEEQDETQEIVVCEGESMDGKEYLLEYVDETKAQAETISCNACGAVFENLQEFEEHQESHRDTKGMQLLPLPESYHCYCGEKFKDLQDFDTHHNLHKTNFNIPLTHSNQKHKCNKCKKIFITASLLENHMYIHDTKVKTKKGTYKKEIRLEEPVLCEVCAKPFYYKSALRLHRNRHLDGKKYSCEHCGKQFSQRISLRKHKFTHINPVTCSHCDLIFRDKDVFELHKVDGVCPMETAKDLIQRWKHEAVTEEGTLVGYICAVCNTFANTEEELVQHIMTTHILDSTTLFCFECGERASSKAELQAHIMTHVQVYNKRISCKVCGVLCESKATLAVHQRVHTNERPFECPVCSQTFKTKIHMQSHQLVHTKEKNHACPICNKCFALKGNMQAHLRGHTGEKPYVCPLCKAAFKDTKILKKHKLMFHQDSDMSWGEYLKVSKTRPSNLALTRSHDY